MTYDRQMSQAALFFLIVTSVFLIWHMAPNGPAHVQAQTPPISSSGLNTQVSAPINLPNNVTQYNITGGTRPGNGPNLFHSFGEFGVPTNNIANFHNETAIPTSNILGRVTGGNVSNIFGTIQTTGFGNANLFLMNPAGFLFGPNATVNVGGMVAFTSADYLRLTDGGRFNANSNAIPTDLLTAAPVATFGFLGSNPGAITVQGSQFAVSEGQSISLVGGNITVQSSTLIDGTVQPARLAAPGGQINLASVVSPGEVFASDFLPASGMMRGGITLAEGARLDVSGNAAGTVRIRSGSFVMENAAISADTLNANGAPVAIDINVTGDLSISTVDVPALTASTTGAGDAGEIRVSSGSMGVNATAVESVLYSVIDTHTSGPGKAGDVSIVTGDLTVIGEPANGFTFFVDSGTTGLEGGHGGDVAITTRIMQAQDTAVSTGNFVALNLGEGSTGSAGNLSITADRLQLTNGYLATDAFSLTSTTGESGNIAITAHDINLDFSVISNLSQERGASIEINTDSLVANNSQILTETGLTPGGGITVNGRIIELTNGSTLVSSTGGDGNAGPIFVTATDHLGLLGPSTNDRPSGIFSNSFGTFGSLGNSGDIVIDTPRLEMTGGGRINTSTATSGRGGNVIINAPDSISMSGETSGQFPEPLFSLGTIQPSGIYTLSIGGNCTGPCGNAGNVSVTTGSLTMGTGSQINSGTRSSGQGGNITVVAGDTIAMAGTLSTGQPGGIHSETIGTEPDSGSGGDIALAAGQSVTISDGASVSASSTGSGNAGNITIQGLTGPTQSVLITGFFDENFNPVGGIFTETQGTGAGGTINISAHEVQLSDGATLSAKTLGSGRAGDIAILASNITVDTSLITAETTGLGNAGNISIVTSPSNSTSNPTTAAVAGPGDEIRITDSSISTKTSGDGNAGTILLQTTGNLSVSGSQIQSLAEPDMTQGFTGGQAGTIQLLAGQDISMTNSVIEVQTIGNKSGGEIVLRGNNLLVEGTILNSLSQPAVGLTGGDAGDIRIDVNGTTRFVDSEIKTTTSGNGNAGNISLTTSKLFLEADSATTFTSTTAPNPGLHGGSGGNILLKVDQMTVTGNSLVSSRSDNSVGQAGNITVIAKDSVELLGSGTQANTITTSSVGAAPSCPGKCGDAGTISITAQTLTLDRAGIASTTAGDGNAGSLELSVGTLTVRNGSQLSAGANGLLSTGAGGNISINATGSVDISNPGQVVGHSRPSGFFTNTEGTGPGGNILVNANTVMLQNGGTLSAQTSGTAPSASGGTITVDSTNTLTMTSGATITANSAGAADAGSINLTATNGLTMQQNSLITTEVTPSDTGSGAGGGNIKITTSPEATVWLQNSKISASVADGPGGGGNISIDPQFVILQNSQILAQAAQGQGGAITIIANLFLPDANSIVNADSGSGVNGTVTIQSPNAPGSGKIQPLGKSPLLPTTLLNQHCAALAGGEFSSFTVAGRDSLPTEPGSWLASPLYAAGVGEGQGVRSQGTPHEPERLAFLSLRQVAPAGFLTQTFAVDRSAGCNS